MKKITRACTLLLLAAALLLSAFSCGGGVPQEDYDSIKAELAAAEDTIAGLENELIEVSVKGAQYDKAQAELEKAKSDLAGSLDRIADLEAEYAALQDRYDAKADQAASIEEMYTEVTQELEALQEQYAAAEFQEVITTEAVEQALFALVNEERANNGVAPLEWGRHLYGWAKDNSSDMHTSGKYIYSAWASWGEILWSTGYISADRMANAVMKTWKINDYRYENNIINTAPTYGAVGIYEADGIFYITYMASTFE